MGLDTPELDNLVVTWFSEQQNVRLSALRVQFAVIRKQLIRELAAIPEPHLALGTGAPCGAD